MKDKKMLGCRYIILSIIFNTLFFVSYSQKGALEKLKYIIGETQYFTDHDKNIRYEGIEKNIFSIQLKEGSINKIFYRKSFKGSLFTSYTTGESYFYQNKVFRAFTQLPKEISKTVYKHTISGSDKFSLRVDTMLNVFQDFSLEDHIIISPFSEKGFKYYKYNYSEVDSNVILFRSKKHLVSGKINIDSNQFKFTEFDFSEKIKFELIDDIVLVQKFKYVNNKILCPTDQVIEYRTDFGDYEGKGKLKHQYKNYIINPVLSIEDLQKEQFEVHTNAANRLTTIEKKIINYRYLIFDQD